MFLSVADGLNLNGCSVENKSKTVLRKTLIGMDELEGGFTKSKRNFLDIM